jgi:two-component system, NarL family, response regulator NreC
MPKQTRILLVEDHRILREGLRAIFDAEDDFVVVGEAGDGMEAIHRAQDLQPDLIVLDLSMPRMNGLDALRGIKRVAPDARVLILTVQMGEEYVFGALRAGADAYLSKDSSSAELVLAVRSIAAGGRFLGSRIATQFTQAYLEGRAPDPEGPTHHLISRRERGGLKLGAEGDRSREIGTYLCISEKTVEKHRANLMRKLQVSNVSGLTAYAIEKGLVTR